MLAAIGFGAYVWVTRRQIANINTLDITNDPILRQLAPGKVAVVYFTTPGCIPCRTQQQPALVEIQRQLGEVVQVVKIDATEQPNAADQWGVMSAPTTFVIDRQGKTRTVNHGVADARTLYKQLSNLV